MLPTITELQHALDTKQTTSEALVAEALKRIQSPDGQGNTTFLKVYADQAMAAAKASDILRAAGLARSPLEGLPISIKDLFDKKGDITR
ncbi:MAG TPA: amidase family protein, partial [Paenalcaligenes sp.]|nr:amidase family protein [Paenalcaligenes sp.]